LIIGDVTLWIPFGFKESIKLVIFDIDDDLVARLVFFDQSADSAHGLTRLARHAN